MAAAGNPHSQTLPQFQEELHELVKDIPKLALGHVAMGQLMMQVLSLARRHHVISLPFLWFLIDCHHIMLCL
jgi:nitrate reductase gamma subunit